MPCGVFVEERVSKRGLRKNSTKKPTFIIFLLVVRCLTAVKKKMYFKMQSLVFSVEADCL